MKGVSRNTLLTASALAAVLAGTAFAQTLRTAATIQFDPFLGGAVSPVDPLLSPSLPMEEVVEEIPVRPPFRPPIRSPFVP